MRCDSTAWLLACPLVCPDFLPVFSNSLSFLFELLELYSGEPFLLGRFFGPFL
jgi:hypothetical protein